MFGVAHFSGAQLRQWWYVKKCSGKDLIFKPSIDLTQHNGVAASLYCFQREMGKKRTKLKKIKDRGTGVGYAKGRY